MKTLTLISSVLCFAATSWACCTPDQWEGYQPVVGGYSGHHGKRGGIGEFAHVAYDFTNKRKAVFMTHVDGEHETKVQIIQRCGDNGQDGCRVWVVDLKKASCFTKKTCCDFRKQCIPKDAKVLGKGFLGLKGVYPITGYQVKKGTITADVTVNNLDGDICVPVSEIVQGTMKGTGFMLTTGFIDITPGIKNETIFDIPTACTEETDMSLEAEFEREHFVLAV